MSKVQVRLNMKDLLVGVLVVGIVALSYIVYILHQNIQGVRQSDNNFAITDVRLQAQVEQLKACIDHNTKPCDLMPVQ